MKKKKRDGLIFLLPFRAAKYHIEMEKVMMLEVLYSLGEVAESGSPFKRWVDVGAGFLNKKKFSCFQKFKL